MALPIFALLTAAGRATKFLTGLYEQRQDATTDRQRNILDSQIKMAEAKVSLLEAEQGKWYTAMIRPLFAMPFIIYLHKVVVYDKVLGLGTTDNLSPDLWVLFTWCFGAYFVGRSVEKSVARYMR